MDDPSILYSSLNNFRLIEKRVYVSFKCRPHHSPIYNSFSKFRLFLYFPIHSEITLFYINSTNCYTKMKKLCSYPYCTTNLDFILNRKYIDI